MIVTRQGKGSFVADSVDLSTSLRLQEMDEHLSAAADIAREVGLAPGDLESRLRDVAGKGWDQR